MKLIPKILIIIFYSIISLYAKDNILLSKLEKDYLNKHQTINIYVEPDIFFYTYTYGNYTNGYAIEYLKVLSNKLDIKFNFISDISREEAKDKLKKGLIDLALLPSYKQTNNDLEFSQLPIGIMKPALLIPKMYQFPPSLETIDNFKIAVAKGEELIPILKENYPDTEIEIVDSTSTVISKIINQEVDLAIGYDEIFTSYIDYKILPELKSIPINNINFPIIKIYLSTKKNNILMNIINKNMTSLDLKKLFYLRNQFFHSDLLRQTNINVPLSENENYYLMEKQLINTCIITNDLPYENIYQGKYEGIGSDIIKILEKNLDIPIQFTVSKTKEDSIKKLLNNECDFLSLDTNSSNIDKNIYNTTTLFEAPLVLITSNNVLFISNFNEILDKSFLILKNHPMINAIKKEFPNINIIETDSEIDALKIIEKNEDYGLITSLYSVSYLFKNHIADNLKISAQLPLKMPFSFAVLKENKYLINILETSISTISKHKIKIILDNQVSKKYPKGFDYTIILLLVIIFIIFFIIMFRQHFIVSLQKESLFKLNTNLESRIKEAVDKNRQKDMLMYRQSRFASMGEMIGNIAHQWRQPLMQLSSLLMELQASIYFKNSVQKEEVLDVVKSSNKVIHFMSHTIDDFRNFFSTNKEKSFFSINEVIEDCIQIMSLTLQHHKIDIIINTKSKKVLAYGLKNEYSQVIINIISNAKDMIILRKINNGHITINIEEDINNAKVSIIDNAGGIDKEDLPKIFEPFFTKKERNSTGIGLFISRMIIENNMGGVISAENSDNGAIFSIVVKKNKE